MVQDVLDVHRQPRVPRRVQAPYHVLQLLDIELLLSVLRKYHYVVVHHADALDLSRQHLVQPLVLLHHHTL